jgi:hypothetical protein
MRYTLKPAVLVAVGTTLAMCGVAHADDDCSTQTLQGLYIFSATGFNIVQGAAQPKAVTESIRFNGDGTLTVPAATASLNGTIVRSPANGAGTYSVGPDCTGRLQFGPPGPAFDLFIGPRGSEFFMIQTGGAVPGVLQGQVKRVSD